jgi:hypothetical protein
MMKCKVIILAFGLILSYAASAEVFEPESQIQNEESKDKD